MARTNTNTGGGNTFSGVTVDGITIVGDGLTTPLSAIQNTSGKYYISGGATWSGTGFIYNVSAVQYFFDGFVTSAPTTVTLAAADPTFNRFDLLVGDELGNISVITGTPSADPVFPSVPDTQLIVGYFNVLAGSTTPTIVGDAIYLDNSPAYWVTSNYTTSGTPSGTTNFAATNSPKQGTACIDNLRDGRTGIKFTRGTTINITQFAYVSFWVRFTTVIANNKSFLIRWDNSVGNPYGNTLNLFNFGIARNVLNTWQQVVIPVTAFGLVSTVKSLRMIMVGGTNGVNVEWDVDWVQLTAGIPPQSAQGPIYLSGLNTLYSSGAATGATNSVQNSIFFGQGAGVFGVNSANSIFLGTNAGYKATDAPDSNFIGNSAGYLASSALHSNFFGREAGYAAGGSYDSNFIGFRAGKNADSANDSNFLGFQAGYNTNPSNSFAANNSNFFGNQAGQDALNASLSTFIGYKAGFQATNATQSVFIGYQAGNNDTTTGNSILIGNNTSSGGFSNSVGIGSGATNTSANQLYVADSIIHVHFAGVSYTLPIVQGGAGTKLTNDGSGNLSWA
jgi:hypothetical protein